MYKWERYEFESFLNVRVSSSVVSIGNCFNVSTTDNPSIKWKAKYYPDREEKVFSIQREAELWLLQKAQNDLYKANDNLNKMMYDLMP